MVSQSNEWRFTTGRAIVTILNTATMRVENVWDFHLRDNEQECRGGRFENFVLRHLDHHADVDDVHNMAVRSSFQECVTWIAANTIGAWSFEIYCVPTMLGYSHTLRFLFDDPDDATLFLLSITRG